MSTQMRLPGVDPSRQIRPAAGRQKPVLWVRRVRIVRELAPGDAHVVRDVVLRPGLNIVWAPPASDAEVNVLFRSGMSGHTAGKTTFCRIVRHLLGERNFASESVRRRIRDKFPAGWLLAEVVVDGQQWAVARPLAAGPHSFCIKGGTIDELATTGARMDYEVFLQDVTRATTGSLPSAVFPGRREPVRWEHILSWLIRDQECRFADFLEWRHGPNTSDAPALGIEERQFLVRSVLGLIGAEESAEQGRNSLLLADKKKAAQREPLVAHQATTDHARVERLMGVTLAPPSSGLFGSEARRALDQRRHALRESEGRLADADRRAELQAELERALSAVAHAEHDLADAQRRLDAESLTLQELTGEAQGAGQMALLAALPPARDYCGVPMALAREGGCPLASTRPLDLGAARSERSAAQEAEVVRRVVAALQTTVAAKRSALLKAEDVTRACRIAFMRAATSYDEERAGLVNERALMAEAERLVGDAEMAWRASEDQAALVHQLTQQIEQSYARQEDLRESGRAALSEFSATFDYVVRAVLGDEVAARVDASGRNLSLVIEHHGERDSAALATVRLLSLDLAAIASSIQGHGSFPRFLVHDGPREADMSPDIYERLFLLVRKLEECFSGDAGFQYIVTTTTRPPKAFVAEPWLRLQLAGAPADERLFRTDL